MTTAAVRTLSISVIVTALAALSLSGCGSSGIRVCNATGCCGATSTLCPAPQFVYATGLNGQVSAFPVDAATGALSAPTSTTGPAVSLGMAALGNQFLYVSDFQLSSIAAWSIAPGMGGLTAVQGSPFPLGPLSVGAGLATNNAAQVVYVADAGKIDAFKVDPSGGLSPLAGSPFPSGTNLSLAIDSGNRFLFAAEPDPPGSVAAFTIDSAGALTPVPGSPFPTIPNFLGNSNPTGIVVDSTGKFVYTALQSTNQIAGFSIVAPGGALNLVPGSPFPAGAGQLAMATVKNLLYVSNAADHTVSIYSIDPATGVLTPIAGSPFSIAAGPLVTDPQGRYLYAAGPGGMLAFTIDPTSGGLRSIGPPIPFAGATVLTFVP